MEEIMNTPVIGEEQLQKLTQILQKYKSGKARTEQRIVSSENWWKLRNGNEEQRDSEIGADGGFTARSGWLHNVIVSKHADLMEAYPEPNILPREEGDRAEAKVLSSIIPVILEQNRYEQTYSDKAWQKLKTGTGVTKVVWDASKLNGLGDISIERCNILNLYWEPGVTDIQRSRYFFHTELMDKDVVEQMFPQAEGKLKGQTFISTRFLYDDNVDMENKVTVIECYYHKRVEGKNTLQYVKYVNDIVLYATENEADMAQRGLYDHGKYPYVFDQLFPIEGSPCGYGFVDLCRNPQTEIDLLKTSFVKNAMVASMPRYFARSDGSVNEKEFLDMSKPLVHVNGNLGTDTLRPIDYNAMNIVPLRVLENTIAELRETSGNTETATGSGTPSGVTAASAIAALQEASGKGSRDANLSAYRSHTEEVMLVIELMRQFYDLPRQFRIIGRNGAEEFITYTNQNLQPQYQGGDFGVDMGYRIPVFDIKVSAQKRSVYSKVSQNELALQFFQLGFFNPQMTDQALMCLDVMDFDGRDSIIQKVAQNGTMFQKLQQYMQLALTMAKIVRPDMVEGLSQDIMQTMGGGISGAATAPTLETADALGQAQTAEHPIVQRARAQSQDASQPSGGTVVAEK